MLRSCRYDNFHIGNSLIFTMGLCRIKVYTEIKSLNILATANIIF